MRNMSAQGRATMAKRRNFVNYARMTLSDGTVLNLQPKDFRISGNEFTDELVDGDNFQFGTVIGKTVTIRLDNEDERFSQYDFYMAKFILYVHLPEAYEDANHVMQDEVFTIGLFTVTEPTTTGTVIDIMGVDEMYKFDKSFDECNLDFSTRPTLYTILAKCCNDCNVAIGFTTFDNSTMSVTTRPEGATYREVVSYVCQIAGANARINTSGALTLIWYDMSVITSGLDGGTFSYQDGDTADGGSFSPWNTGYAFDGGNFNTAAGFHQLAQVKGLTISTDDIHVTGVRVTYQDDSVLAGTEGYVIELKDNPFTFEKLNQIATFLLSKLSSLVFRPFSCNYVQDITIEAGDVAVVWDIKGNAYNTIITNVKFSTNSFMDISCNAKSPAKQKSTYKNSAAQAVVEARRNTEQQIDSYAQTVDHFNEIANAALGYYKTETTEQGATITYYHDASTLQASTNIVKVTGSGIFISDDGGQSYSSGYEISTATMLMNLVYAHGITADWVESGIFRDKQGKFVLDLDNSTLKLDLSSQVGSTTLGTMVNKITANENGLSAEITRATNAESSLSTRITANADGLSSEVTRAKSAERELSTVYSGDYEPTTSNLPASQWTATSVKQQHENDVFLDTSTGNSYQWQQLLGGVQITFSSSCVTENRSPSSSDDSQWFWDYVVIYYYDRDIESYRRTKYLGGEGATNNIAGTTIFIPGTSFYIYFHSDGSTTKWGYSIDTVNATAGTKDDFKTIVNSLPTGVTQYTITGVSTKPETSHEYSNNQNLLWYWNTQLNVTNRYDWLLRQDIETMQSSITQTASQIALKVSKGEVSSQLSVESGQIKLASGRLVIESGNFQVDSNGYLTCYGADIRGTVTAGNINSAYVYMHDSRIVGHYNGGSRTNDEDSDASFIEFNNLINYGGTQRRIIQLKGNGASFSVNNIYVANNEGGLSVSKGQTGGFWAQTGDLDGNYTWISFVKGICVNGL